MSDFITIWKGLDKPTRDAIVKTSRVPITTINNVVYGDRKLGLSSMIALSKTCPELFTFAMMRPDKDFTGCKLK